MTTKIIKTITLAAVLMFNKGVAQTEVNNSDSKPPAKDTSKQIQRPFQFTFISPISTNGLEAYKITNRVSINWIAGVNGGVNGLEAGGFVNVITKNVKGIQAAGFVNAVKDSVDGGQFAGFVNYAGGSLNGGQFAGFVNYSGRNVRGGQAAGFVNVGLGTLKGAQFSGFANYNRKDLKGIQASGYVNVCSGNLVGAQLSGFTNVAKNVTGFQGTGFANIARDVNGVQASGFINVAKNVKGYQLGFINVADSVDGASIGFCNIVRKGLHQIELSADELFYTNVSIRTGTHKFYNIFSAGFGTKPQGLIWQIGYGAGTSFKITEKWRSDVSISAHHVSNGLLYFGTSELYKVYWGVEYKLANKLTIAGGPTFNLYWGDALQSDFAKKYSGIAPYTLVNETNTYGFNYKAWVGARVAIRFL